MKQFYLLTIVLSVFANAQLSIVKDVTLAGLSPTSNKQAFWQNNKWNGKYYFEAGTTVKLVVTDGTDAGTMMIKDLGITGGTITKIIPAQDFFYFQINVMVFSPSFAMHDELWRSDGTAAGTFLLKEFSNTTSYPLDIGSDLSDYYNYSILGNEMFFSGYTTASGKELWKSDGTVAGTVMVKDITTGAGNTPMDAFTRLGTDVYFFTGTGQLWKSDGTNAGTVNIPLPAGLVVYMYNTMVEFNGKLIFLGYDATNGMEPWITDGTTSGTHIIKNISPQTSYYYTWKNFAFRKIPGGVLLPIQTTGDTSNTMLTLWKTDGTDVGTVQLSPTDAIQGSTSDTFAMNNESLYTYNGGTMQTIFKTNYQENGYQILSHTNPVVESFFNFKNTLWFSSGFINYTQDQKEPWRSDGTQAVKTLDIRPGLFPSLPFGYFEINNNLYFFANDGSGNKLYKFVEDFTFNGSVNTNWSNSANWNSAITPLSTENVTIPAATNVIIDAEAYANNVLQDSPINLSGGNLNIGGSLNLGAKITLNGNNLNLKGSFSQVINGNASNYVVTNGTGTVNVENLNAARSAVTLPIGTSTNFNPVTISNTGTSDTFSARVSDGISNAPNGVVNVTWDISEGAVGGSNVNLNFVWNAAQQNATFSAASAKVGHYYNGQWNQENSGSVTGSGPFAITATGITTFSPFGVMSFGALATAEVRNSSVHVYPNPFSNYLQVETEENGTLMLFDASGKVIDVAMVKKGNNRLEMGVIPAGLYHYALKNLKGGTIASGKLLKN